MKVRVDFRGSLKPVGAVVLGLGVTIALCALVGFVFDLLDPEPAHYRTGGELELLLAAIITLASGGALFAIGGRYERATLSRREALFAVAIIWVAAGIFGGLPFWFAAGLDPAAAFFESISGLTTTGATVVGDIEGQIPTSILLWRSLIQWLGGMGIVVLFVAVFPNVGAGGKKMFRGEVPGTQAEGLKPRIAETSYTLWRLYAVFTLIVMGLLMLCGMTTFEALCHALTCMSTGGFSTRAASVGGFHNPAVEYVLAVFMVIGSVNYGLYYLALRGKSFKVFWKSVEFRVFCVIVALCTGLLTFFTLEQHGGDVLESFRYSFFMVATTVSSTGYGTDDYTAYAPIALHIVLLMMFIGGCSGSTAGGMKIERVILLAKLSWVQIKKSFRPALIEVVRMGKQPIRQEILNDVAAFTALFFVTIGIGVVFVTVVEGIPIPTAFGAMLTCISNMGPGPFHDHVPGMVDNFSSYSWATKLFFTYVMLLGRLEIFTLVALFVPNFWKT